MRICKEQSSNLFHAFSKMYNEHTEVTTADAALTVSTSGERCDVMP